MNSSINLWSYSFSFKYPLLSNRILFKIFHLHDDLQTFSIVDNVLKMTEITQQNCVYNHSLNTSSSVFVWYFDTFSKSTDYFDSTLLDSIHIFYDFFFQYLPIDHLIQVIQIIEQKYRQNHSFLIQLLIIS